jgi:hypothetical protein
VNGPPGERGRPPHQKAATDTNLNTPILPPVSASPEVIDHHLALHRRECGPDRGAIRWESPCRDVAVWQCKRCDGLVAWAYRVWCRHAAEFWASVQ